MAKGNGVERKSHAVQKGVSVMDLIFRILALIGTLGSAFAMATTNQRLPFFNSFTQFKARYRDIPAFIFFVAANGIVSAYLLLSLPFSFFHILRSSAQRTRLILMFFDMAMLVILTAGASAAAAIVYLAHIGNPNWNWFSFCRQFHSFCERSSGSLIGSFVAVIFMTLVIILAGVALARRA
ncbi:hypothetical protein ERO13_A05G368100v2 [Gossypium hirsutum]|uniref:CASP-like protein n=5 Tax=Gossypium TaxID=3633 RepID=A0ABR0Q823_GOSAR|nr:casparian strip membrane protein 3 [Gossypium arboreum]XP_040970239.1 casparian strip membrane protein 3-like [Gossypium hirsutum]TYH20198.1 hypothetical protein ES288_A05G412200v1 [Gossypium darwinii]TYI30830.1 hypothetical protein ES332_A05G414200v1 [Gossypium tomentosum]TYJ37771.1 hypothetical protein E1A91_A05G398800v1 [Gossypium mustelinum]KAG4202920.1 hypothetical protein ERO13_A05G368100v2 [Gossypium hirsutum]KAK5835219.1 hypothetical protein PVK06_010906 [Gossypium arboreum]